MNFIRRLALYAPLVFAAAMLPAKAAFGSNLDFDLDNETSTNIDALYISLNAQSNWGDPVTNGATNAGATNSISFDNDASGDDCDYDFKVVFDSGLISHLYNIDLCSANKIEVGTTEDGRVEYTVTYTTDDH